MIHGPDHIEHATRSSPEREAVFDKLAELAKEQPPAKATLIMHPLLEEFKEFCKEHANEPLLEETEWYDMSLGWFSAKGADIETAIDLAVEARYDYLYWTDK